MSSSPTEQDPHPELPRCFSDRTYVEQVVREMHSTASAQASDSREKPLILGEKESATDTSVPPSDEKQAVVPPNKKWRPERLVRTCVSSMVCSDRFGPLVAGEAQRRGFYEASRRAFLGDGQAWNWTLQETYFPDFVPIADFVHPLGYVYDAAKILAPDDPWPLYLRATTDCWKGRVANVLQELRMLIKEINYRVKGTEKFWNRPEGAEQILQIRAAALNDDDRLSQWILNRRGSLFHRSSTNKKHQLATAA